MRPRQLSTKLLLVSALTLILFSLVGFLILNQAQSTLANREMDTLLENEALSLAGLVNIDAKGQLDFELSFYFLQKYQQNRASLFFRFIRESDQRVLKESLGAPGLGCDASERISLHGGGASGSVLRTFAYSFRPDPDEDVILPAGAPPAPALCLVVGINEAPYRALVRKTIFAAIPPLVALLTVALFSWAS